MISIESFNLNGQRDSLYLLYHNNGREYIKGSFNDGEKIGEWTTWDENGKIVNKENYPLE
jgi:antitoxin component YwqK of YwqJK toxin-antitoxin module